ncbi:hypothetical protein [Thioalkalivibrio sp. ALJ16]|uniref:hypothetical protein n=1 Tax=Thioalkalivibrio sp. ALJ16 TaxID=1158762 RepID=UPI00035E4E56|nr:hypothetical protein [Thioalkalivibrio sp. ALJ16]
MTAGAWRPTVAYLLPGLWARSGPLEAAAPPRAVHRLGRWLGRARAYGGAGLAIGWEAALAERIGYRPTASGARHFLASPVQLTPGMKDLVAHPVDAVEEAEREALWAAAQPELEAAGAQLVMAADGLWELRMEAEGEVSGLPPSLGLGRAMSAPPLHGEAARRLQVLTTGLQMAWFQHPVNLQRERDGRGAVHGLWLWSPGRPGAESAAGRVCGGGALGRWLAAGAGLDWQADPAAAPVAQGDTVVVVDALAAPPTPERRLELLESVATEVVAPRMRGLRRGDIKALEFIDPQAEPGTGPGALALGRGDLLAFWRRARRP